MELYIIRHGQSTNNALEDQAQRTHDPELTDLGHRQAERLAAYLADGHNRDPWTDPATGLSRAETLAGFGLTHLYCSPMHRALQTARPIAKALGLKPEVWIDIHEHGGIYLETPSGVVGYGGRTRAEIAADFPDYVLPETVTDEGWWDRKLGMESLHGAYGRAIRVAMELRRRANAEYVPDVHTGEGSGTPVRQRIAIVTHGTFIDALIKALLNQLPSRHFFYLHFNTAVTRIDFIDKDRLLIRATNRIAHLPPEMIS